MAADVAGRQAEPSHPSLRRATLFLLFILAIPGVSSARTWTMGAGEGYDFTSLAVACSTAVDGDSIRIAPGDYVETKPQILVDHKALTILGHSQDDTRIQLSQVGADQPHSLYFYVSTALLSDLCFHDSTMPIYCNGSFLTIQRCTFSHNAADPLSNGGAITNWQSEQGLILEDCLFLGNTASGASGQGGAVWGTRITARRCTFVDNSATDSGGAIYTYETPLIDHCIFLRNSAQTGAAVMYAGVRMAHISNSTLFGNVITTAPGAAFVMYGEGCYVENTIISGTINGKGADCRDGVTFNCCDFWSNEQGDGIGWCGFDTDLGNVFTDPLFCGPETRDLRLSEGSPCLPGQHGGVDCGLIGALDLGCNIVPVQKVTWGRIKLGFK